MGALYYGPRWPFGIRNAAQGNRADTIMTYEVSNTRKERARERIPSPRLHQHDDAAPTIQYSKEGTAGASRPYSFTGRGHELKYEDTLQLNSERREYCQG